MSQEYECMKESTQEGKKKILHKFVVVIEKCNKVILIFKRKWREKKKPSRIKKN